MELKAIRYFLTVAEFGSYSRASEYLRISQPAVSRAIRGLEEELGSALFRRHGRGVNLTQAGRILADRGHDTIRQLEQTAAEIRGGETGPSGAVSIAVPPAAGTYLAPALIERCAALYPNVFIQIVGGYSGYIHEWLVRGQVDLACLTGPAPQRGFAVTPLLREEVFVVGRRGAFPVVRKRLRVGDLAGLSLILPTRPNASRRMLDEWTARSDIWLQADLEVDDHMVTRALLNKGLGFSLLTSGAFADGVARGELEARPLQPRAFWPLALISVERTQRSELVAQVAAVLIDAVCALSASGTWPCEPAEGLNG